MQYYLGYFSLLSKPQYNSFLLNFYDKEFLSSSDFFITSLQFSDVDFFIKLKKEKPLNSFTFLFFKSINHSKVDQTATIQ